MKRALLMAVGFIAVALAVLGIVLPLLPTTPFLLLAGYCFARSSPRFLRWLLSHRVLGPYIRSYREGTLDQRTRWRTIGILWLTLLASALVLDASLHLRLGLAAVGVGVTWHLLALRRARAGASVAAGAAGADADSQAGRPPHTVDADAPQKATAARES
jgi:uncharacterized membrane protein YbaN (DUF454 family)